jgi:hypothetical protein
MPATIALTNSPTHANSMQLPSKDLGPPDSDFETFHPRSKQIQAVLEITL